jgi:CBS domain-containing protein
MPYTSRARDVMTTNVITAKSTDSIADLVTRICEHKISGLPVVDGEGRIVGIVSKTDLLASELAHQFDHVYEVDLKVIFNAMGETAPPSVDVMKSADGAGGARVGSIMKSPVITASPDTPLTEIALLMQTHNIHRVVITEEERIAGIVTSMDLLRLIAEKNGRGGKGHA